MQAVTDKLPVEVRDNGAVVLAWAFAKPKAVLLPFQARAIGEAILRAADEAAEMAPEVAEDPSTRFDKVTADVDATATEIEVGDVSLYRRRTQVLNTRTGEQIVVVEVTGRLTVERGLMSQSQPMRAGDELYVIGTPE